MTACCLCCFMSLKSALYHWRTWRKKKKMQIAEHLFVSFSIPLSAVVCRMAPLTYVNSLNPLSVCHKLFYWFYSPWVLTCTAPRKVGLFHVNVFLRERRGLYSSAFLFIVQQIHLKKKKKERKEKRHHSRYH